MNPVAKNSVPGTKVIKCNCESEQQDKMYGKGMRVHNRIDQKGKAIGYACTICTQRRGPADKHVAIVPNPAFGIKHSFAAPKARTLKSL